MRAPKLRPSKTVPSSRASQAFLKSGDSYSGGCNSYFIRWRSWSELELVRSACACGLQNKLECRANARLGFDPDFPAAALDDFAAQSQPDSCAGVAVPVQPLEYSEDARQNYPQ